MGAGHLLRELDSRVLPPLARGMARIGQGPVRLRALTAVALACAAAVVMTAVWAVDEAPHGEPSSPDLVQVGVLEGQAVAGYVRSSRGELTALVHPSTGPVVVAPTYALVSFGAYFAPQRLITVIGGVSVAEVYARAPLFGLQTPVLRLPVSRIPDDVEAGLLDAARRRDREAADYRRLSASLPGADGDRQRLRRAYDSAAQIAAAEAAAYRSGCSCIFAAVVWATPAELAQVAGRSEVRAVDPAPEVHRLDRAEFRPPLPEQRAEAESSMRALAPRAPSVELTSAVPGWGASQRLGRGRSAALGGWADSGVTSGNVGLAGPVSGPVVESMSEAVVPSASSGRSTTGASRAAAGASPDAYGR